MTEITTGTLVVTRPSTFFAKFRAYPIFVDGEKIGAVKDDSAVTYALSAGSHEVWSKIDWMESNRAKISIEAGKTAKIRVGYKRKEGRLLLVPVTLSLLAIASGTALGTAFLTTIGIIGLLLSRVGSLRLDAEANT